MPETLSVHNSYKDGFWVEGVPDSIHEQGKEKGKVYNIDGDVKLHLGPPGFSIQVINGKGNLKIVEHFLTEIDCITGRVAEIVAEAFLLSPIIVLNTPVTYFRIKGVEGDILFLSHEGKHECKYPKRKRRFALFTNHSNSGSITIQSVNNRGVEVLEENLRKPVVVGRIFEIKTLLWYRELHSPWREPPKEWSIIASIDGQSVVLN